MGARTLAAALAFALAAALPAAAEVTIVPADERPLRGEVVRVLVESDGAPAAGYRMVAVYRPNSQTGYEEELVAVDAGGVVMWTPLEAGPAILQAWDPASDPAGGSPAATYTLAVRYGGFPPSGLLIMILAGLLLFGGAASALVLLLRPGAAAAPPEPPST